MNTSIKLKKAYWPQFVKACESQWIGGGDRYALSEDKEFTDLIYEIDPSFIGSTIIKYCGEIINLRRAGESVPTVNFFKIGVYGFLWWLKEQENMTDRDKGEEFEK